jgi:glycosyltransferase involved in cell wall biosynthesis
VKAQVSHWSNPIDSYVLPSRSEGLSLSLLEAMAASKPVIVTDVGMNGRVIQNELNGLITPPESPDALAGALMRVLADPDLAMKLGQKAFETVTGRYSV